MTVPGQRVLLGTTAVAVAVAVAAFGLTVRFDLVPALLAIAWTMTLVPAALCLTTIVRNRRNPTQRSALEPTLLAWSTVLLAIAVVLIGIPYLGVAIDFLLVPIAVMVLLLAWVQPRDEDYAATAVLGLALAPLATWFIGRADEFLGEALISGTAILLISAALTAFRNRGQLAGR